jgi:hypothetical protein
MYSVVLEAMSWDASKKFLSEQKHTTSVLSSSAAATEPAGSTGWSCPYSGYWVVDIQVVTRYYQKDCLKSFVREEIVGAMEPVEVRLVVEGSSEAVGAGHSFEVGHSSEMVVEYNFEVAIEPDSEEVKYSSEKVADHSSEPVVGHSSEELVGHNLEVVVNSFVMTGNDLVHSSTTESYLVVVHS